MSYRGRAAEYQADGDAEQAQQCEEFARRCDALAAMCPCTGC